MASLMWHKTHKHSASRGDLYTLPDEAPGPRRGSLKAAQGCRTSLPLSRSAAHYRSRRGHGDGETPGNGRQCVADSSAPTVTLPAKPLTAYHFIALSGERRVSWRLYHAWAPPWFPASPAPTFLATYPFGTLRKTTLEQIP